MNQPRPDLTNLTAYQASCLEIARKRLSAYASLEQIARAEDDINAWPGLERLAPPRDVRVLDEDQISPREIEAAQGAVLEGRLFCEHTAAGEATRLKLGTKFMINPATDLALPRLAELMSAEFKRPVSRPEILGQLAMEPERMMDLNLGQRHMLQMAFDLTRLARQHGLDPQKALAAQKMLIVLNEKTADSIVEQFHAMNFFGFDKDRVFFMVQPAFHGIGLDKGRFFFDQASPRRLHNHGQLAMQETMDHQVFRSPKPATRQTLTAAEFQLVLESCLDKISYNIEDLGYLGQAIDLPALALALRLGEEGFAMVMEIVANNPKRPQKGGMAAFDPALGRDVMIESFQLKGVANEEIKFLNKNFNHYPHPARAFAALKKHGLPMPIAVKHGRLYFQPVQGDLNLLVKTAFVQRKNLKPIRAWKDLATTVEALNAMAAQERQEGFAAFAAALARPRGGEIVS